jgi:hypothetical protein
LAGGLNLYGYAAGDPVNYSDPFGLCVTPTTKVVCVAVAKTTGTAVVRSAAVTGVALVAAGGAVLAAGSVAVEAIETAVGVNLGSASGGLQSAALRAQFPAVRRAYWRAEAAANADAYSSENVARMKSGSAPIGDDGAPMELHHVVPLRDGGTNDVSNLKAMTQTEHRRGENYKKNHPDDE